MLPHDARPELWGGVECTLNRVQDRYNDQLLRSGHLQRLDDIDRFADLGLSALRVPLIWERSCPTGEEPCFDWAAPMLERVRQRGLRAIAGLVHHGSGPRFTDLLDPQFEHKLARYARSAAERFPWIKDYTPINEPLTTARFSALYGHWYPHERSTAPFLRALVHQCRGTVRAMREIRKVQPAARLIQTEDMAYVRSTPLLAYQAKYENARRFLSFDLLCGKVDAQHPLYAHLLQNGISKEDLTLFLDEPCPPSVIGINYYFTSDRYLDENCAAYPAWCHGANGRHTYADIDAGHVPGVGLVGHAALLRSVWERYRLPLALTEVHAGCTREEQLRWWREAWLAACQARAEGVDVQAVTGWALLGSFDWNSLACVEAGVYEVGVFDLRAKQPRPTAIAGMIQSLAKTGSFEHPVLDTPGWWRREASAHTGQRAVEVKPILITGASGGLAQSFARACETRGLACVLLTRQQLDVSQHARVRGALAAIHPWAVINAAGVSRADEAELDPEACWRHNVDGARILAEECGKAGARLLTFSSDLVFDGKLDVPYMESDAASPQSVYGTAQAEAERHVLDVLADAFVVRTSALFGPWHPESELARALRELAHGRPVSVPSMCFSPTYTPHLVDSVLDLLIDGATQRWHLTHGGSESFAELLRRIAGRAKLSVELVREDGETSAKPLRSGFNALASKHGSFLPSLDQALDRYCAELSLPGRVSERAA